MHSLFETSENIEFKENLSLNNKTDFNKSEREAIFSKIYSLHISEQERNFRKKENWRRFISHCKLQGLPTSEQLVIEAFKKTPLFLKEYDVKTMAIKLSHIPTDDLYYLYSICKDRYNRRENVGSWLFAQISPNFNNKYDNKKTTFNC